MPPRDYLLKRVKKDPETECWWWQRCRNPAGYGKFRYAKVYYSAHRASFEVFVRPLAVGEIVMHTCDTPSCINPAHLRAGTHKQNTHDALRKGRLKPHLAKLCRTQVIALRAQRSYGVPASALAAQYGVNRATVWGIVARRYWRHVP